MVRESSDRISEIFAEGTPIDEALTRAAREAVEQHRRAGNPIAVGREGMVVWLSPDEISLESNA